MRFMTPESKGKPEHTAERMWPAREFELKLEFRDDGRVVIVAEDPEGYVWNLLALNTDGTFSRVNSVPGNIGFSVNARGQIKEKDTDR